MKKLALSLVVATAALGLAASSFAQQPGPRGAGQRQQGGMRRMGGMNNEILAKLNLTADQKTKIAALQKKSREKMMELRKDFQPGGDRSAMRTKLQAMQKENRAELQKILTPAQLKQFDALVKEQRQKMRQQRQQNGGRPNGAPQGGGL